jgi:RsiW-degrading membrane proteinase PrsW (M82 family)
MKSTFYYIVFIAFSTFAFWVAFTWDIPVDNQIAMAFMGVMCLALFIMLAFYDIKELVKNRKNKPQTF